MRTRQKLAPMDGTTISNLCPGAFDPNFDAPSRNRSLCIDHSSCEVAKLRVLEVGDKLTALSKIEKDPKRCQTLQLMVL
jgi:hypothetical protein